jgi:hypothetical protein
MIRKKASVIITATTKFFFGVRDFSIFLLIPLLLFWAIQALFCLVAFFRGGLENVKSLFSHWALSSVDISRLEAHSWKSIVLSELYILFITLFLLFINWHRFSSLFSLLKER